MQGLNPTKELMELVLLRLLRHVQQEVLILGSFSRGACAVWRGIACAPLLPNSSLSFGGFSLLNPAATSTINETSGTLEPPSPCHLL